MNQLSKTYLAKLADIEARYNHELNELGEQVRQHIIMPICKKHVLTYMSWNGSGHFTDKDESYCHIWEIDDQELAKVLGPVFVMLKTEIGRNAYLGDYVRDVMEEDYK